jgi:hypothetical protein
MSPESIAQLAILREKSRAGTITLEEQKEALRIMREDRVAAATTSAKSKARKSDAAAKKAISSDDLLSELEGL